MQNVWAKVTFARSDLLKNLDQEFDVVLANLPYLKKETNLSTMHEPKLALLSPDNGLKHNKNLITQLSGWQKHPEFLFMEAEPQQAKTLEAFAKKFLPHTQTRIIKDSTAFNR